jgi:hypothetical protein
MSKAANGSAQEVEMGLPAFSLDVQAMDLGAGVKAVSLEILETESREPVRGRRATEFWVAALNLLAASEPLVVDFFSHLDRIRDFCLAKQISFREGGPRCVVVRQPTTEQLQQLFDRFESETFGVRAGERALENDVPLTGELSRRGLDAYQEAYSRYSFCAVCEFDDGWVTMLSEKIWPSEVIRRVRPAAQSFDVFISRPQ